MWPQKAQAALEPSGDPEGQWVAAACSKELVLNGASHWDKPLWRLVLEVPPAGE